MAKTSSGISFSVLVLVVLLINFLRYNIMLLKVEDVYSRDVCAWLWSLSLCGCVVRVLGTADLTHTFTWTVLRPVRTGCIMRHRVNCIKIGRLVLGVYLQKHKISQT